MVLPPHRLLTIAKLIWVLSLQFAFYVTADSAVALQPVADSAFQNNTQAAPGGTLELPAPAQAPVSLNEVAEPASEHSIETTLIPPISNPNVFDCVWPPSYDKRIQFCVNRTGLDFTGTGIDRNEMALYGVLSRDVVDKLTENCLKNDRCPGQYDLEHLKNFVKFWWTNSDKLAAFSSCLKLNTEGIVKNCDPASEVCVRRDSVGLTKDLREHATYGKTPGSRLQGERSADAEYKIKVDHRTPISHYNA